MEDVGHDVVLLKFREGEVGIACGGMFENNTAARVVLNAVKEYLVHMFEHGSNGSRCSSGRVGCRE